MEVGSDAAAVESLENYLMAMQGGSQDCHNRDRLSLNSVTETEVSDARSGIKYGAARALIRTMQPSHNSHFTRLTKLRQPTNFLSYYTAQ